jgi:UDPglucose 6-dehydrogenase
MSQVQPGYTRSLTKKYGLEFIYQVETLVFGQALHRALNPERFIVGLPNWNDKLNKTYEAFLLSYSVPIFKMDFESAELSKIAINLYLASTLTTTNALAEICEFIGADWELIKPALRLDKRIGSHAYLTPGLGISGGNIERDISTALRFSDNLKGSKQVFESMRSHSANRKLWPSQVLRREFPRTKQRPKITVWGLAYKRNTHSIKNSPAIANIANLFTDYDLHVSDPLIKECPPYTNYVTYHDNPLSALENSNALLILTDWEIYSQFSSKQILENMENTIIIDPYGIASDGLSSFPKYFTLGRRENSEERLDHE